MKKEKSKQQIESEELQRDNKELDRLMRQPAEENEHSDKNPEESFPDGLGPASLAEFAIMMAAQARLMSLVKVLFPLLDRIQAGEKITEKEILDKLSSVKIGNKTALEKLTYLREQQ